MDPQSAPSGVTARGTASGCFHCGLPCPPTVEAGRNPAYCCVGCQTVSEMLLNNGLGHFYDLVPRAGVRQEAEPAVERYQFLDEAAVRARFVDFTDGLQTRVTFRLPTMHCVACIWLLENLFRLRPGIGVSRVDFPRRQIAIAFSDAAVKLSEIAQLLDQLGYAPDLNLADLEAGVGARKTPRGLWLRVGVAGFAFGNSMLLSLPGYFGLDRFIGPDFRHLVGWLSFALAVPVVVFSASDYWRRAWVSFQLRRMSIEVPIALGIAALFLQSLFEVAVGRGDGYFDSLAGLLFFLLCGRLFQEKTVDRMAFDRDYKSFFPLSVRRLKGDQDESVSLDRLAVGDRIHLRNGELIPADARLLRGPAIIDYSFVTGEADPVSRAPGETIYAGGRQTGAAIVLELIKPVSQSYLTSLWNQDIFKKEKLDSFNNLTNRYSQRFTWSILAIALVSAAFWAWADPAKSVRALVGVLIVACPCALALAAPFTLGTALRVLGWYKVFLRKAEVLENLARVDCVVFDKTGTLTTPGTGEIAFEGQPLAAAEAAWIRELARQSTHPLAERLATSLTGAATTFVTTDFQEVAGGGMAGTIDGHLILLGSIAWLRRSLGTAAEAAGVPAGRGHAEGSVVSVAIDGRYRGHFTVASPLRLGTTDMVNALSGAYEVSLLSGDNERDAQRFASLFGPGVELRFNQSPHDKLNFIRARQQAGRCVMMVGDGLNDAGALQQSDVGVAVVENVGAFSPASDVILHAPQLAIVPAMLRFARQSVRIVRWSFMLSAAYNVVGLAIAASGRLEPITCAILMPLSSVSVVAFAVGLTHWAGRTVPRDLAGAAKTNFGLAMTRKEQHA